MPATIEPPEQAGKTSVGSALNALLRANPELEKKLAEPITSAEVQAAQSKPAAKAPEIVIDPRSTIRPPDENPPAAEPAKVEAPKTERSKVFGTEVKKPEAAPVAQTDAEETKGMTPKAEMKWRELKAELAATKEREEAARRERDELGQKINTSSELPAQLEALKAELAAAKAARDEMEQELSINAVDRSKEFVAQVAQPKQEIQTAAEAIAKKYDLPVKKVLSALEEPVDARTDALEELGDLRAGDLQVLNLLGMEMDKVQRTAEALREKAKTSREHLTAERQTQGEAAQLEARKTAEQIAAKVWSEAAKTHAFLSGKTGDEAWDKWVTTELRPSSVDTSNPAKVGEAYARAAMAPALEKAVDHYRGLYEQAQADVSALEGRLSRYEKSEPGLGGRGDDVPRKVEDGRSPGEVIASKFLRR